MMSSPCGTETALLAACLSHRRWRRLLAPALLAVTLISAPVAADDSTVPVPEAKGRITQVLVPLSIDYPLVEQLLIAQLFTDPGGSREVLNDPSGCSEVVLSAPAMSAKDASLELMADLRARIGVGGAGACATMVSWQGRMGISGRPDIRNNGTALGFTPDRVWLLDPAGQPVVNDALQSLADSSVRTAFSRFLVDLTPQLQSVADFIPEVLPRHSRAQIEALLTTLRLANLQAANDTLDVSIAFNVEPLSEPLAPERALTDAELADWEERWQLMDSLLVLAVKHYAAATQLQGLRDALLDTLIESRYRLRDALTEPPNTGTDTVRDWFLQSWQALTPIIRRIGMEQPGQEHLLLLSVIAATDALEVLDQLGPNVGLDVSSDGLRRLARMIIRGTDGESLLQYSEDLDPGLRRLLDESVKSMPVPAAWRLEFSLFPKAVAADLGRLNSWAPKRQDLKEYLPLAAALLSSSARELSARRNLEASYREMYRHLVLTTAWQESCWRHYVISDDKKLVPLRSGTGDVGLMQVNERIWRGFYKQQELRWNIEYNSAAGAEVLIDYLLKNAIRSGEHRQPGGMANLARASYSAYNGGPSQVSRYRNSKASAYGKKVDASFWEKYQQVAAGNELAVSRCFGGDLSGPATAVSGAGSTSAGATGAAKVNSPANVSPAAKASASSRFTLQLGAFSSEQAARTFITQNALGTLSRVQQRGRGNTAQYLVLHGEYGTRAEAENARRGLGKLEPWIRQLTDLE